MEFAPNGDLDRLIERIMGSWDRPKQELPDRVLWRIFRNLARAVELMDSVDRTMLPQTSPPPSSSSPTSSASGSTNPLVAAVFASAAAKANKLVHFDIKPQNTLIGDIVPGGDPLVPVVKMADFGLAQFIDESE
ncbi:hypothetical protein PFICI_07135 [Pestalotiopsis fici W106-1]|uniref:Protein kinase domain-containing protein n=1 Tax=Pestalotiopsis fici (strain W106-1 / CGMCC3.15140) TaxID=1229662 RepID=W3X7N5_PESFW|nr:uncharacterized protein PFICI_07135 [Pestalotiopsis fici W106-1]ETS82133.1 hypothetical protein PFICI_07135 [Pestalotiopsis fici W106-1]